MLLGVSGDDSGDSSSATPYASARDDAATRGGLGRGGLGRSGDGGSGRGDAGGLAKPPPPAPPFTHTPSHTPMPGDCGGVGGEAEGVRMCGGTNGLTRGDCGDPGGTVTVSLAPPGAVPVAAAPR
jgi:hypothetical protein